jgi:ABC-type transporter Mla subunit MlaD
MTSQLEQLWEEAGRRLVELSGRADAGATAAGHMIERAQTIGIQAIDEAKNLHAEYEEAIAAVKHAAEEAEKAADEAGRVVLAVPGEVHKAATAVSELLSAVHQEIHELGELRVKLVNGLSESAKQADTEFNDLALQVQEFAAHLDARLKEASDHVERLEQILENAQTEVHKTRDRFKDAVLHLGKAAGETTGDTTHALEQILAAVSYDIVSFCSNTVRLHNDLTAAVRTDFLNETKDQPDPTETWVEPALKTLREAIAGFALLPIPAETMLVDTVATILGEGEKAVASLDTVAGALRQAVPQVTP